jgi:putative ABC transport system permease protein
MTHLRQTLRQLAHAPGFTAIIVLTLGLGIGACAAIFTVVNGVLLRPPPFATARTVLINEVLPLQPATTVPIGKYVAWKSQAHSFEDMGAMAGQSYNLTGAGEPIHLIGGRITASMMTTLGLAPILGRNFLPGEELPYGQEQTAILGYGLWQSHFGGRPDVLGRTIQLNGRAFTLVGVMPAETGLPERVQIFTPLGFTEYERRSFGSLFSHVLGRLKPAVTLATARAEMTAIIERTAAGLGLPSPSSRGWALRLTPLMDSIVGDVRPILLSLLGAVGFLLLIACSNVASLLLARATSRRAEFALRAALGASRGRLIRQMLSESLLLSFLGGALGMLVAHLGLAALLALAPEALPRSGRIAVDGRALAVTIVLAALSAVLFGLAPARQAARAQLHDNLKRAGRGARGGGPGERLRGMLVSSQVAIALILLAGAGLMMRSFARLQAVDPGFDVGGAYVAETFLPRPQYATHEQYVAFAERTLAELKALPGVEAAAVANNLPFSKHHGTYPMMARIGLPGQPTRGPDDQTLANEVSVSADYFRGMGIPFLRGRTFDSRDGRGGAPTVIVSASLARRFFPGQEALGRTLQVLGGPREIIGIVGDVKQSSLEADSPLQIYRPFSQDSDNDLLFVVRTRNRADEPRLLAALRAAITRADPNVPVFAAQPLEAAVGGSIARQRFAMTVFVVFSGAALLLAAIGLYGIMAYAVTQRTGEIGIRMALGAQGRTVARLVLSRGGRLVGLGVAAGLVGSLLLAGFLEKLLFRVSPHDPATFTLVVVVLALVSVPACLVPALRAARVDPMVALRRE